MCESLELALGVEGTFDIQIHDDDYKKLRTLDDLHKYICEKLAEDGRLSEESRCLTGKSFLHVRKVIASLCSGKTRIRPSTALDALLPIEGRRACWNAINEEFDHQLPSLLLNRNKLEICFAFVFSLVAGLGLGAVSFSWTLAVIGFVYTLFLSPVFALILLASLAKTFPVHCVTVGDLARLTAPLQIERSDRKQASPTEVRTIVDCLVMRVFGVKRSDVCPESTLHELCEQE